jgi:hypothetical protein
MHYGVGVTPARVRRPCDKGKVEVGVQIACVRSSPHFAIASSSRPLDRAFVARSRTVAKGLLACRQPGGTPFCPLPGYED